MPIIDRKSRLAGFGAAGYIVFATVITYMATVSSGWLSGPQLAIIPLVLLVPLVNALYTVRQLDKLEKQHLLTQPAADVLFKAALTQLSVGYATPVLLLPAFLR
jgi:hypothetical protein